MKEELTLKHIENTNEKKVNPKLTVYNIIKLAKFIHNPDMMTFFKKPISVLKYILENMNVFYPWSHLKVYLNLL